MQLVGGRVYVDMAIRICTPCAYHDMLLTFVAVNFVAPRIGLTIYRIARDILIT